MIELKNLSKQFETADGSVDALRHINLTIRDGDIYGIIGMSGAGKSTLVRCINMLERPTEGSVLVNGKDIGALKQKELRAMRRKITMIFQGFNLLMQRTCLKNVTLPLRLSGIDRKTAEAKARELLALVDLPDKANSYPAQLSGGQQQRVAIARTLAPNPKVLFMDEPLSNLDAKLRAEMRTELKRLHKDTGATFVYVTHDQLEAMTLSSRICLMSKGVVQQFDAPLTVYNRPANLFVADFVGNPTMNFIDCEIKKGNDGYAVRFLGETGKFVPRETVDLKDGSYVLGIRPELIRISDTGALTMSAYATLPSGLETTIKLKKGETIISSIQFGAIDYEVDRELHCDIIGDRACLFEKDSTGLAAMGSVSF